MTVYRKTSWWLLVIISLTAVLPIRQLAAADPAIARPQTRLILDIELTADDSLHGVALDASGNPRAQIPVALIGERRVHRTITDARGRFRITPAAAGVSKLTTGHAEIGVRCWMNGTAPPQAKSQVLLADQGIQRGQRPIGDFLAGPVLIGLIIAAAIAIPIAVHNSKSSAS